MPQDIRFYTALTAARQLAELDRVPLTPERLSKMTYTILEAMVQAERALAASSCRILCPQCSRRCRHVIQACLREGEWADADREFYLIIREELVREGIEDRLNRSGATPAPLAELQAVAERRNT